jgi:hypothetical protein
MPTPRRGLALGQAQSSTMPQSMASDHSLRAVDAMLDCAVLLGLAWEHLEDTV